MERQYGITVSCVYFLVLVSSACGIGDIVWSVNAGGDKHTDVYGITYQKDTLNEGVPSDYGKSMLIQRVPQPDQIIYQTERYHETSFSYSIPLKQDGDYVLVLKFCEVWFNAPSQKVFSVELNDEHNIVDNIDIYSKVGRGIAHDEVIPFRVKSKQLIVNGKKSSISGGKVSLRFVKGHLDNPKLNAAYVMKGTVADVPALPALPEPEDVDEYDDGEDPEPVQDSSIPRKSHKSGPKVVDPYAYADTSSYLIPIVVAVGAFIPLLYCLCKI